MSLTPEHKRFTKYCSATGNNRTKSFSLKKYTVEEADRLGKEFIESIEKLNEEYKAKRALEKAVIREEKQKKLLETRVKINKPPGRPRRLADSSQPKKSNILQTSNIETEDEQEASDEPLEVEDVLQTAVHTPVESKPMVLTGKPIIKESKIEKEDKEDLSFKKIKLKDAIDLIKANNSTYTINIVGSSKSGKTTLLNKIYDSLKGDKITMFFSENMNAPIYNSIKSSKDTLVRDNFDGTMIKKAHSINSESHENKRYEFLVILDDIVDAKEDAVLTKLYKTYRNMGFTTVQCIQDSTGIKKANRGNVNYIFLLRLNNDELISDVLERYVKGFLSGSFDDKIAKYKALTKDYGIIFIDSLNNQLYIIDR